MSVIQIVSITDLDQLNQMDDNDFLVVYDADTTTWKRIEKNKIQLEMAAHDNSVHTTNYLAVDSNLADLSSVPSARINLGLDNTLNRNNNFSDLTDIDAAITNLGLENLSNTDIRTQGNYNILDTDTNLEVGKKYIIKENVTATLPTEVVVGNEIEIVCGESFGDTDVLDSLIDPDGLNIEGDTATLQMTTESFRLVYTGTGYGWSHI